MPPNKKFRWNPVVVKHIDMQCSGAWPVSLHQSISSVRLACVCTSALTGLVVPVAAAKMDHPHTHTQYVHYSRCLCANLQYREPT